MRHFPERSWTEVAFPCFTVVKSFTSWYALLLLFFLRVLFNLATLFTSLVFCKLYLPLKRSFLNKINPSVYYLPQATISNVKGCQHPLCLPQATCVCSLLQTHCTCLKRSFLCMKPFADRMSSSVGFSVSGPLQTVSTSSDRF